MIQHIQRTLIFSCCLNSYALYRNTNQNSYLFDCFIPYSFNWMITTQLEQKNLVLIDNIFSLFFFWNVIDAVLAFLCWRTFDSHLLTNKELLGEKRGFENQMTGIETVASERTIDLTCWSILWIKTIIGNNRRRKWKRKKGRSKSKGKENRPIMAAPIKQYWSRRNNRFSFYDGQGHDDATL